MFSRPASWRSFTPGWSSMKVARPWDVEGERDRRLLERAPERLPRRIAVVRRARGVGEGVHLHTARPLLRDALERGARLRDAAVDGQDRDADEAPAARALQLEEP